MGAGPPERAEEIETIVSGLGATRRASVRETIRRDVGAQREPSRAGPKRSLPHLELSLDGLDGERKEEIVEAPLGDDPEYLVRSKLGSGGMGAVFLGEQRSLGRQVAIKTVGALSPTIAHYEPSVARLAGNLGPPLALAAVWGYSAAEWRKKNAPPK